MFLLLQGFIAYDNSVIIDFWPGKALLKDRKTWGILLLRGSVTGNYFQSSRKHNSEGLSKVIKKSLLNLMSYISESSIGYNGNSRLQH